MTKSDKFKYPDSLDLDDQLAYGVGTLVANWSVIETLFYGLLEVLAGRAKTDTARVIWLSLRTTEARLNLILQLAKVQTIAPVTAKDVESMCNRFTGISKVRNWFCHAVYRADASGKLQFLENTRLGHADDPLSVERKPLNKATLNEISHTIGEASQLNRDLWLLLIRLHETLPAGQHLELPPERDEYLAR